MDSARQAALDLCWAVNSPSLVTGADVAATTPITLNSIDHEHLASFLAEQQAVHRVGRYFEQLIHYWLRHVRGVEVVATGLQLKDDKITVGEIDFLFRDESDTLVHCEASVKYFLCAPGEEPSEFPGPNARDNFEAKATKLFDKQLLASVGRIDGVGARHGLVKGMIFYHEAEQPVTPPSRLPDTHLRGRWLRFSELQSLDSPEHHFTTVPKPFWLAPVLDAKPESFNDLHATLTDHFAGDGHPMMVSKRDATNPEVELERMFIVSERWPER